MSRQSTMATTIVVLLCLTSVHANASPLGSSNNNKSSPFPRIADVSHASPELAKFFYGYSTEKSTGNNKAWLKYWNPKYTEYYDSTLGLAIAANRSQLEATFGSDNTNKPPGASYPLRIVGDTYHGAAVYFVDTPVIFGQEIRAIAALDFLDGTIRRQLDNWDGRDNNVTKTLGPKQYNPTQGLPGTPRIPILAATELKRVVSSLSAALAKGNATAAAKLFNYDAVFEDLTLRLRVEGSISIESYLRRVLADGEVLPYGRGSSVTHVVGSKLGGAYEWRPAASSRVRYGITMIELDCDGKVSRFTATWDGARLSAEQIRGLAELAPSP